MTPSPSYVSSLAQWETPSGRSEDVIPNGHEHAEMLPGTALFTGLFPSVHRCLLSACDLPSPIPQAVTEAVNT